MVGMIKTAVALLARVTVLFFFNLRRLMLLPARKTSGGAWCHVLQGQLEVHHEQHHDRTSGSSSGFLLQHACFSLMVSFRRARARRSTAYGTRYWLFVATCMLGRGCGTTFADFEFGEVGTFVSLLSPSRFFVKNALEQGQRGLSHVHKLGFVLLFFFKKKELREVDASRV